MSRSSRASLLALPLLLTAASPAVAATPAPTVDPTPPPPPLTGPPINPTPPPPVPFVSAISSTTLYNFGNGGPFTISGRNFGGATSVSFGGAVASGASLQVQSDNTIKVDPLPTALPSLGPYAVTVTGPYGTSPASSVTSVDAYYGPYRPYDVSSPVTCQLGGSAGAQFDATLKISTGSTPGSSTFDTFKGRLFVPHTAALTNNPLGLPTAPQATATSIDVDVVTGTGTTSRNLLENDTSGAAFTFTSTGSDNPMEFRLGGPSVPATGIPADAAVVLRGYRASVPLTTGAAYPLDCTPVGGTAVIYGTLPTPTPPVQTPTPPAQTPTPPAQTPTPPAQTPTPPAQTPTPPAQTPTPPIYQPRTSYAISGSATLKTLTKGTLPISGAADASVNLGTGAVSADLTFAQSTGNLVALGFLPVTAKVAIVPQGPAVGTLRDDALAVTEKVRIKLPSVTLFGLQLAGGSGCQAKNVSSIALRSVGDFTVFEGGSIAGTFSISDLVNCGALTGLVSPLTAGGGNAIALKLTPTS